MSYIVVLLVLFATAASGADYRRVPEHAISGHNIQTLGNVTVRDCQLACDQRGDCVTFDYTRNGKTCYLQDTAKGARRSSAYDHYVKLPDTAVSGGHYRLVSQHAISGRNIQTLQDVTVFDCEAACDQRDDCVTFDYTRGGRTCYLQNTAQGARPSSAYDHYMKPGAGPASGGRYRLIPKHAISGHNIKTLYKVSVPDCEVACDRRKDCVTCDYARDKNTCYLQNTTQGARPAAAYDHYVKPGAR